MLGPEPPTPGSSENQFAFRIQARFFAQVIINLRRLQLCLDCASLLRYKIILLCSLHGRRLDRICQQKLCHGPWFPGYLVSCIELSDTIPFIYFKLGHESHELRYRFPILTHLALLHAWYHGCRLYY